MPSHGTHGTNETTNSAAGIDPAQMLQFGKERTEAMIHVQKELLDAYQEASKAWVDRVQSEVKFWSELAGKLAASRSFPDGMEACSESIAHRLQMAAEDGRRLFEDGQKMIAAMTGSLTNGRAKT
jgi:Phasin protein